MSNLIAFPNMFDNAGGRVATVSGDAANRQALKCVLLTSLGELLGDPLFGCDLKSLLFEITSDFFQTLLQDSIVTAANKFVKDITVTSAHVNVSDTYDEDKIIIVVNYYTKSTGCADMLQLVVQSDGSLTTL